MSNKHTGQWKRKSSNGFQVSTANTELVNFPIDDNRTVRIYHRITLYCDKQCTVIRNGNERMVLMSSGIVLDEFNTPTHSLIIVEPNITYYYVADY